MSSTWRRPNNRRLATSNKLCHPPDSSSSMTMRKTALVLLKKLACFDPQCKKDTPSLQALSQKLHRPRNGVEEHVVWINKTVVVTKYVHND